MASVVGRTRRAYESSMKRYSDRIRSAMIERLRTLQATYAELEYCDAMTDSMVNHAIKDKRAGDPLYEAHRHVREQWTATQQPYITIDDDTDPVIVQAAAIVRGYGAVLFEIVTGQKFLDELNYQFGFFPEQ